MKNRTHHNANVKYIPKTTYMFRNIKYSAEELPYVISAFAAGHLPISFFKYYNGKAYANRVPRCPVEGAEIVTMPNYETFAFYRNGMWVLVVEAIHPPVHAVAVNNRIIPYIAGVRTINF